LASGSKGRLTVNSLGLNSLSQPCPFHTMVHTRRLTDPVVVLKVAATAAALAACRATGVFVPREPGADDSVHLLQQRRLLNMRPRQRTSVAEGPFAGQRHCRSIGGDLAQCFPDVMLVGQSKAGTTSIAMYLSNLPAMVTQQDPANWLQVGNKPLSLEVHIFDFHQQSEDSLLRRHWATAPKIPAERVDKTLQLHYTPNYLYYPDTPFLIASVYPNARSIKYLVMLRNPVKRAVSSWKFHQKLTGDLRTFAQVVEQGIAQRRALEACYERALMLIGDASVHTVGELPIPLMRNVTSACFWDRPDTHDRTIPAELPLTLMHAHVDKGVYLDQVERWFAVLGRKNFFIFSLEEWIADTTGTFAKMMDFIGIPAVGPGGFHDATEMNRSLSVIYNDGDDLLSFIPEPKDPDPALIQRLGDFYKPYMEGLFELLGRRLW